MNTHTHRQRPALIVSVCIVFSPQRSMCTYVLPEQTEGPIGSRDGEKMEEKFFEPYISIFCMV